MLDNFIEKVKELREEELEVGTSRGVLAIQQTVRNSKKTELVNALYESLKSIEDDMGVIVYITKTGPVIEIQNDSVEEQVEKMSKENPDLYNGMLSIEIDIKIKNLDYHPDEEERDFLFKKEQQEEKAREKEALKKRKIEKDAEIRAEKERQRQRKLDRYLEESEDEE